MDKRKGPVPYSKEYMQQKWGTSVQSYAVQKGLSKSPKALQRNLKNMGISNKVTLFS